MKFFVPKPNVENFDGLYVHGVLYFIMLAVSPRIQLNNSKHFDWVNLPQSLQFKVNSTNTLLLKQYDSNNVNGRKKRAAKR